MKYAGAGASEGLNINIPWDVIKRLSHEKGVGDDEYIYVFERILMPIFKKFDP